MLAGQDPVPPEQFFRAVLRFCHTIGDEDEGFAWSKLNPLQRKREFRN